MPTGRGSTASTRQNVRVVCRIRPQYAKEPGYCYYNSY